jgi:ferritin-like metal-binding protein YciE
MPIANAQEVFLHELGDIYDAEHRFLEGQQFMAQKATNQDLKSAIDRHIEQTGEQIRNLQRVFERLGQEPHRETCDASMGLLSEARQDIDGSENEAVCDLVVDTAVVKVEHYEIASYRNLITGARLMERSEIEHLLQENLQQEEETARIAESSAETLLRKAMGEQEGPGEETKGLIGEAKEKLTGR